MKDDKGEKILMYCLYLLAASLTAFCILVFVYMIIHMFA